MQAMNVLEAKLFRMLQDIFGGDNVLPFMRLKAITGGELPEVRLDKSLKKNPEDLKCLFTIIDQEDEPKMVIDLDAKEDDDTIDVLSFEKQNAVKSYLKKTNIKYLLISIYEVEQILDTTTELTLADCLNSKISLNPKSL